MKKEFVDMINMITLVLSLTVLPLLVGIYFGLIAFTNNIWQLAIASAIFFVFGLVMTIGFLPTRTRRK